MNYLLKRSLLCASTIFILFFSGSCKFGQSKGSVGNEASNSDSVILERATLAFYKIPDHACVSKEAELFMTEDLYNALLTAWNLPDWCVDIGGGESLSYFVTGNGGGCVGEVESVKIDSVQGSNYIIELKYSVVACEDEPVTGYYGTSTIRLSMVEEDGKWMLDNFGNNTKAWCKKYIAHEVNDFLSGETHKYMKSYDENTYTDEYIKDFDQLFKEFMARNRDYLDKIL